MSGFIGRLIEQASSPRPQVEPSTSLALDALDFSTPPETSKSNRHSVTIQDNLRPDGSENERVSAFENNPAGRAKMPCENSDPGPTDDCSEMMSLESSPAELVHPSEECTDQPDVSALPSETPLFPDDTGTVGTTEWLETSDPSSRHIDNLPPDQAVDKPSKATPGIVTNSAPTSPALPAVEAQSSASPWAETSDKNQPGSRSVSSSPPLDPPASGQVAHQERGASRLATPVGKDGTSSSSPVYCLPAEHPVGLVGDRLKPSPDFRRDHPPNIQVTIGRIDVKAPKEEPVTPVLRSTPPRTQPRTSLDNHLRKRMEELG